ncbi:transposase [Massilia sp. SR12]
MKEIVNNAVFEPQAQCPWTNVFRVIYIDQQSNTCVLIDVQEKPKKPWLCDRAVLQQMIRDHQIVRTELRIPEFMMALEEEIPEKYRLIRDRQWQRIRDLVAPSQRHETHMPHSMGPAISAHAARIGVEKKTLYRLLYRYWMFGAVPNALLPQFVKCGGRGKERNYTGARGRPPNVVMAGDERTSKILSEDDKAVLRAGFALYKDNKTGTVKQAYIRMLRRFYCESIGVPGFPDAEPKLKPLSELPTQSQFEYWGKKAFDDMVVLRSRQGERKWAKDHRAQKGRAADGLMGPAHRFEIDATIADIYLVSRYNRNWIIGRPVVYVVIDVFSRMIVGTYIGLEGPSWEGARQALLNAFTEKTAFCASLGIVIDEHDWPCAHLPQELCADRAELLGQQAEASAAALGINMAYPPPYRPDWKSIVESRFRLLNNLTQIHWIPGGVAARVRERGERDYRLDATFDVGEFSKIVVEGILHHNRFHEYPDLLTREMIQAEIAPTPAAIWNWGFDQGAAMANDQPEELVKLNLMGKARASIRAGGLYFEGMYYTLDSGEEDARYSRARYRGSEEVDVWYQNNDPSQVWMRTRERQLVRYVLRDSTEKYANVRLEEILDMHLLTRHRPPERRHAALQSEVRLDASIEAAVNTATAERMEGAVPASKAERVADIRMHRAVEKESLRRELRGAPRTPEMVAPVMDEAGNDGFGSRRGEVISILSRLSKGEHE